MEHSDLQHDEVRVLAGCDQAAAAGGVGVRRREIDVGLIHHHDATVAALQQCDDLGPVQELRSQRAAASARQKAARARRGNSTDRQRRSAWLQRTLQEGLPGEQRNIILVSAVVAAMMASTSMSNSVVCGTLTTPTSLVCAETEYIPYVGGQMITYPAGAALPSVCCCHQFAVPAPGAVGVLAAVERLGRNG